MNADHDKHEPRIDEALLDEALAPEPVPAGLNERIVAATLPQLQAQRASGVAGRLGFMAVMRVAAVLLLVVGVGLWALRATWSPGPTTPDPSLAQVQAELEAVIAADAPDAALIDQQIELLALQVELVQTDPVWPGVDEPIADAAADLQVQQLTSEMMLMF